jgi:hypothetical protein
MTLMIGLHHFFRNIKKCRPRLRVRNSNSNSTYSINKPCTFIFINIQVRISEAFILTQIIIIQLEIRLS